MVVKASPAEMCKTLADKGLLWLWSCLWFGQGLGWTVPSNFRSREILWFVYRYTRFYFIIFMYTCCSGFYKCDHHGPTPPIRRPRFHFLSCYQMALGWNCQRSSLCSIFSFSTSISFPLPFQFVCSKHFKEQDFWKVMTKSQVEA